MDPFLIVGGGLLVAAWLKKRNEPAGASGAAPSQSVNATPAAPVVNKMAIGQTPPVSSEMSLDTRAVPSFQSPLYPAGIWSGTAPLSQGSGSEPNDDGRVFSPQSQVQDISPARMGSVQDWTDLTIADPTYVAPTILAPTPPPAAAPEVAAPQAPKANLPPPVPFKDQALHFTQAEA